MVQVNYNLFSAGRTGDAQPPQEVVYDDVEFLQEDNPNTSENEAIRLTDKPKNGDEIKNFLSNMGVDDQALLDQAATAFSDLTYKEILQLLDINNDGKVDGSDKVGDTVEAFKTIEQVNAYAEASLRAEQAKKEEVAQEDLEKIIFGAGDSFNEQAFRAFIQELGIVDDTNGNGTDDEIEALITHFQGKTKQEIMDELTGVDSADAKTKTMDKMEINNLTKSVMAA